MRFRVWTWAKDRSATKQIQRLENTRFEFLRGDRPDRHELDLSTRKFTDGTDLAKGATDFGAISRIEIDEEGKNVLSVDTVPLAESALPYLKDSQSKDLGLWPIGFHTQEKEGNYSAWQTLRTSWPTASYLRIVRDGDDISAFLRLQLHLPIIPFRSNLSQGVSAKRANDLAKALMPLQQGARVTRSAWSDLHHCRSSSLAAISLVFYNNHGGRGGIRFQGLATHSSLARFDTAGRFSEEHSKNGSPIKFGDVHRKADGQFILSPPVASLGNAVGQLGNAAGGCLPLTRYTPASSEATIAEVENAPLVGTLPFLESLGLSITPMWAPENAGSDKSAFPYQHLHLRRIDSDEKDGADDLEWLTWIKLAHPVDPAAIHARPCLLRYRQLEKTPANKKAVPGEEAPYSISLEGLTGAHVLHIWSKLAGKPARDRFAAKYGKKIPSLLPDLFEGPTNGASDEPGTYVATIECMRINKGVEFLGAGQSTPDLQPDEIHKVTIRRAKDGPARPSEPFPTEPNVFVNLEVSGNTWVRFPDLRDTENKMAKVRSGSINFHTEELTFNCVDGEWELAQDTKVELGTRAGADGEFLDLAISSIDFKLQQRLASNAQLHLKADADFDIENLRIPIAEAWVRGTDADAVGDEVTGLRLQRQAAVWSTSGEALLKGGELSLQHGRHDEGHETTFNIYRGSAEQEISTGENLEFAIVDPAPFFVGAVSLQSPGAEKLDSDERLASWSSDDARWRLLWLEKAIPENRLRLPAQGRAEDWERIKTEGVEPPRDGILEGGRVAARFTRPAVVRVQAEERLRAPTGPWNILETLTDAEADLPGARMTAVERLEILYGLEAHSGRTENLRIAETESWRGRPALLPIQLKGSGKDALRAKDWRNADRLWASRLAVIEARKVYPGVGELIENLPYRLRRKVEHGAEYKNPLVWKLKEENPTDPPDLVEYEHAKEDWFTEDGTSGGVFGGFERAEVLDALIRDADTGLGTIRQLAFSARGATSDGDAAFGTGLTRIAFKSELGRLTEIRFERMGRISCFRHKARHVIVYRLRATPSKQFASRQDTHQGRLLIRKDEEFVELIDPVREFPGRDTGPIESFEFRDRKIRVDGAWSSGLDGGGSYCGYAIPLWRSEADPAIYPRPDCACHMAGPNGDVFPRSVSNPDIIRFYSLTELNGAAPSGDTETWPNIYGLDYADRRLDEPLADDKAIPSREDFGAVGDPARPLPAEPLVIPGLEHFTILLEEGQSVDVMAGRPADPVYCDLRSLVVMRAAHSQAPGEKRSPQPSSVTDGQKVVRHAQRLAEASRNRPQTGWTLTSLKEAVAETREGVAAFPSSAGTFANRVLSVADEPLRRLVVLSKRLAKVDEPQELLAMWNGGRQQLIDQLVALEREIGSIMPVGDHLYAEAERLLRLDESETKLREEVTEFLTRQAAQVDGLCADLLAQLDSVQSDVLAAFKAVSAGLEKGQYDFAEARRQAALAAQQIGRAIALSQQRLSELPPYSTKLEELSLKFGGRVPALAQFAQGLAAELRRAPRLAKRAAVLELALRAEIDRLVGLIDHGEEQVGEAKKIADQLHEGFSERFAREVLSPVIELRKDWHAPEGGGLAPLVKNATEIVNGVIAETKGLIEKSRTKHLGKIAGPAHDLLGEVLAVLQLARDAVGAGDPPKTQLERLASLASTAKSEVDDIIGAVGGIRKELSKALSLGLDTLEDIANTAKAKLEALEGELDKLIAAGAKLEQAYDEIAKQLELLENSASRFAEGVNILLDEQARKDLLKPLEQRAKADNLQEAIGLRLLRGCGAPPVVENLIFNRDQIGYHYRSEYDRLVTTPMTALVDQGQEVLRAFGVTQPVLGIGDEFLSPVSGAFDDVKGAADQVLENLKMRGNEVLRDLAGLKKLFPSMPYDKALAKAITVKHGFDPASGQAWLLAKFDHKIGKQPIFEQEMFSLLAQNAKLTAEARFEQPVTGGEQSATSKAEVTMDIVFMIGGTRLLAVRDAKVLFDDSGLKFKIRPEKIEFNKLLQLVSDAIRSLTGEDSPLQLELLIDEESGRPIGLASKYDLPPVSFGPILNASLGVHLILAQRETFRIESLAYLGNRDAPFALVYGILGGGGYIEAEAAYVPETGRTDLAIRISIGASAGTGFSFGPLRGSVSVYLGFTLDYISETGGERLTIGAVLVVNGSVRAWSIVTVSLNLRLAVTYDGRQMLGVGRVTVTVKISKFYKKKFRRPIRYRL